MSRGWASPSAGSPVANASLPKPSDALLPSLVCLEGQSFLQTLCLSTLSSPEIPLRAEVVGMFVVAAGNLLYRHLQQRRHVSAREWMLTMARTTCINPTRNYKSAVKYRQKKKRSSIIHRSGSTVLFCLPHKWQNNCRHDNFAEL